MRKRGCRVWRPSTGASTGQCPGQLIASDMQSRQRIPCPYILSKQMPVHKALASETRTIYIRRCKEEGDLDMQITTHCRRTICWNLAVDDGEFCSGLCRSMHTRRASLAGAHGTTKAEQARMDLVADPAFIFNSPYRKPDGTLKDEFIFP